MNVRCAGERDAIICSGDFKNYLWVIDVQILREINFYVGYIDCRVKLDDIAASCIISIDKVLAKT